MKAKVHTEDQAMKVWQVVEPAFLAIYLKQQVHLKYQDLFNVFHILTISSFSSQVQEWLGKAFEQIANRLCDQLELLTATSEGSHLAEFNEELANYNNLIDKVKKIAVYYDTRFAITQRSLSSQVIGLRTLQFKVVGEPAKKYFEEEKEKERLEKEAIEAESPQAHLRQESRMQHQTNTHKEIRIFSLEDGARGRDNIGAASGGSENSNPNDVFDELSDMVAKSAGSKRNEPKPIVLETYIKEILSAIQAHRKNRYYNLLELRTAITNLVNQA